MKKLLFLILLCLWMVTLVFSQATINCFPLSGDYNTGSTNSTSFTQTSLIKTECPLVEAGWARFDISAIPVGATIQSVELNIYVAIDNFAYWQAVAVDIDPLAATAPDLFAEIIAGGGTQYYAEWSGDDFPQPDWWTPDLGPEAVTDLQENLDNDDGWFAVGLWEFETLTGYAVTFNGWNETYQPYLEVSYLVPGAPLPTYDPNPEDEAMNIEIDSDISWTFGANTDTYDLYFGLDFPPTTKVVDNASAGTSGVFDPGILEFETYYYWQVVSKNSAADMETPGPVWSFKTKCDTWAVPFTEDFENVTPPGISDCWFRIVNSYAFWAQVQTNDYGGINNSNSLYMDNSEDFGAVLIFATPQIDGGVAGKYANFYAYGTAPLSVGTMTDPTDENTYTEFLNLTLNDNCQEFEVFFTDYTGPDEYIAFKHGSTMAYQYLYMDNILIDIAPTCPKPSDQYLVSASLTSATVGWTENGTATMWNLEYGLKGFTPTGTPTISVNSNPYEITGLNSSTQYDFYVQADCGSGDLSYWVGPFEFATQCEAFDVPVFEDFDLASIPDLPVCWSAIEESTLPYAYVSTVDYNFLSEPNCIALYNDADISPTLILISPQLNVPVNQLWLNFFAWSYSPQLSIGTITDPSNSSTYTEYTTVTLSSQYMDYQEYEVDFSSYSGSDEYIAIKAVFAYTYDGVYIDDLIIDHPPTCPKPQDPYTTYQTTNSVTIGWTETGTAAIWNIEYGYEGFVPTGTGNAVANSNPYNLTGLESATLYDYYVQADCGAGDVSYWVGPTKFKTACESTTVPYFEGFEDASLPEPPICVIVENVNEDDMFWYTANDNPYEGSQVFRVNYNYAESMDDWFFSAPLELTGNETYIVQFYYTSNSASYIDKLEVKWGEYPSSMAMTSEAIFQDTSINYAFVYHEGIGYFTPPSDGIYYVGWHGFSEPDQFNIYVDNILIDVAPSCLKPTDLYASSTSANSSTLEWIENGSATLWNIEYGYEGFAPTGTPNAFANTNPFELTGLEAATTYDVYIQADCGGGDVSWWEGPAIFTTQCESFDVPVFESFDNVINPELPLCWSQLIESTSPWANISSINWNYYSPPNSISFWNDSDMNAELLLISPILSDPVNTLWVNFFASGFASGFSVGTITNPLDASTYTEVSSVIFSGIEFEEYEVFFDDYTGSDQYIAFKVILSGIYQECLIDNITIDHPPSCPKPSDLFAQDLTTNSAMLGWNENGTATMWNIEYGEQGFIPTGNPNAYANSNPFELTGLIEATYYEYYVQADCGGGDVSYWVGPLLFQTLCNPAPLPYEEGFEDVVLPFVPPCIIVENTNSDDLFWQSSMVNPNSGNYHLEIGWNGGVSMNDWFFSAPLELLGGQSYNVVFYYTNNSDYYVERLEVLWGDQPNSDAMVNGPIWSDETIQYMGVYQEASTSFSPTEDGIYFVGWHGFSDPNQYDLYVDDIYIEWDNSLVITAIADPSEICEGENSQLYGSAVGGSGNFTFTWTSDPPGFNSNEQNPVVTPAETTDYILEVNDGFVSIFDTVTVTVIPMPGIPGTPSGITFVCAQWESTTYNSTGTPNATTYNWIIDPEDAGEITGTSTSATVIWSNSFLGQANLSVAGVNNFCEGEESDPLLITRYLPDVSLDPFDTVCVGWPAFELTGGSPSGGVYSGTGVNNGWFDPEVAGVGVHTITYTFVDVALCENFAEQDILVDLCTGIQVPDDIHIAVHPNPNTGQFKVIIDGIISEKSNIILINSLGVEVYKELNLELDGRYTSEINLEGNSKGLYYLYVSSENFNYIEKVIVN